MCARFHCENSRYPNGSMLLFSMITSKFCGSTFSLLLSRTKGFAVNTQPSNTVAQSENDAAGSQQTAQTETLEEEDLFDREEVMKFINDAGLLSYNVRALSINDYLKSLYRMAHLLTMSKLHREAIREVQN